MISVVLLRFPACRRWAESAEEIRDRSRIGLRLSWSNDPWPIRRRTDSGANPCSVRLGTRSLGNSRIGRTRVARRARRWSRYRTAGHLTRLPDSPSRLFRVDIAGPTVGFRIQKKGPEFPADRPEERTPTSRMRFSIARRRVSRQILPTSARRG